MAEYALKYILREHQTFFCRKHCSETHKGQIICQVLTTDHLSAARHKEKLLKSEG